MNVQLITALLLGAAVLVGWARLLLWQRSAADLGARAWRLVTLLLLQPVVALLLYFGLFPPALPVAGATLTVATQGSSRFASAGKGAHLVALPEAPDMAGAQAVPDLATALRRYPDTRRLVILGQGLVARDRDAARGLAIDYTPPATAAGLIALARPDRIAPGATFAVGGQVAGLPKAQVELLDPAGRVTDAAPVDGEGRFRLTGTARAAGTAEFTLRLRRADGGLVEQAVVPLRIEGDAAPRLLILAGAPGPEVKYLRRWATDAGYAVTVNMSAGGGIALGDGPVAINAASLRRYDLLVADDRAWAGLGGGRGAVLEAVRGGMGLILRGGGPADGALRSQWRALGFDLSGGNGVAPIALPASLAADRARTRAGIGSDDVPADLNIGDDLLPEAIRMDGVPAGGDVVPLVQDAAGTPLAAWRALGAGRVAVWTGIDSFGLVLSGRGDLYGDWWGRMMAAIVRPAAAAGPAFTGPAWVGERISLCGLKPGASIDGAPLAIDPATADCAAWWSDRAGWHQVRRTDGSSAAFYIYPANALPAMRTAQMRQAMTLLQGADQKTDSATAARSVPGPSWPWLLGWLIASALLWWFERSRIGRTAAPQS
ncbi:carboxypeptidase regulatory-like domain-containing protein [Sphingobium yanoikuyae]|uniref:carboxypeptidase regulatory-like domain-containing protein n=1 Tax=Sphingobium yanoikuyae TaxID=13690 RepID=UPI0035ADBE75